MTTGERIKQRRLELGMTQAELAEKTGYSDKSSIAVIESGKNNLRQSKIQAFAESKRFFVRENRMAEAHPQP